MVLERRLRRLEYRLAEHRLPLLAACFVPLPDEARLHGDDWGLSGCLLPGHSVVRNDVDLRCVVGGLCLVALALIWTMLRNDEQLPRAFLRVLVQQTEVQVVQLHVRIGSSHFEALVDVPIGRLHLNQLPGLPVPGVD